MTTAPAPETPADSTSVASDAPLPASVEQVAAAAPLPPSVGPVDASAATTTPTLAIVGLILSIASIVFGQGVLAIAGVVLGFLSRRREPNGRTPAIWAIVLGLVSLFGWLVLLVVGVAVVTPFALFGVLTGS